MMVSLKKRLNQGLDDRLEHEFFTRTLQYLGLSSCQEIDMDDWMISWMITSDEVDFGHEIGSGALCVCPFGNTLMYC
jgi:hypothetical protein